jgi:hypothetical protein
MSDTGSKRPKNDPPLDLGIYGRETGRRTGPADIIAAVLSVVWLVAVLFFFFVMNEDERPTFDPLRFVFTFLAILLPIAMIWVAAAVSKTSRVMREEAQRLQTAIDAMRKTYVVQQQTAGMSIRPSIEKKLDQIAEAQKKTETAIATFHTRRETGKNDQDSTQKAALPRDENASVDNQPSLALGTPAADLVDPITISEFVRAVNFPENESDQEGFRTLRRALADREIARLIRSAQDVLTLLSQDGIYMDDLRPDRSKPETWRLFAQGKRGGDIAALAGIRDRSCLALANGRIKQDPVFRDATHHFLRQFDSVFTEFETNASDEEIMSFAETRTARAFMLLGRVAGTFD